MNLGSRSVLILLVFLCADNQAEVLSSDDHGFVSAHTLTLKGSPEQVYSVLTEGIHQWWDAAHSYSGKAENFSLQARALGCFCEQLKNGGSVVHMQVVFANPGKELRLAGGLGPLQELGAGGTMTFKLSTSEENQTQLQYQYSVTGYREGGLASWAKPVDAVQLGQLLRLQRFLETGSPEDQ